MNRPSEESRMFANRLRKNMKHLSRWLKRENIHCYRLYDADIPEYAVAVDIYQGEKRWVHVQEYAPPGSIDQQKSRERLRDALIHVREVLEIPQQQLFLKVRLPQRGKRQYQKLSSRRRFHDVMENGCRFLVNFEDYLDTGLFLDHRLTRRMLGEMSEGRRFLNLFAYTGSATVLAASGGALSTTTLDMSKNYIAWARRNFALNGIRGKQHRLIQTDCLSWLEKARNRETFDLIFLDPPSFSSSKRMQGTFDVQRDHVQLIKSTSTLLAPDGLLIFSNNRRHFEMDREGLGDLQVENISSSTLPRDFERNPRIHNCWRIRKPS